MSSSPVQLERHGTVAVVVLSRSSRRNALDDRAVEALVATMGQLGDARAAVLTGAGDESFCAGYDLRCIDPDQPAELPLPDQRFAAACDAVRDCAVPVVAALNGDAFGGGLDLALACDLRVGRPDLRLAMTPCRLGLVYHARGLRRIAARIGSQATRRLFLTATPIDAQEALRLGVLDKIAADPRQHALGWARAIAANAPLAIAGTRAALDALEADPALGEPTTRTHLEALRHRAFRSRDLRRGLEAILGRQQASFEGD